MISMLVLGGVLLLTNQVLGWTIHDPETEDLSCNLYVEEKALTYHR